MRRAVVLLVLVLALVTPATSALGDPPSRGCAPPFEPINLQGFIQLILELFPEAPQDEIVAFFNEVDINDDGIICSQEKLPEGHFNVVDNASNADPPGLE
jgi:hypothetical protein